MLASSDVTLKLIQLSLDGGGCSQNQDIRAPSTIVSIFCQHRRPPNTIWIHPGLLSRPGSIMPNLGICLT